MSDYFYEVFNNMPRQGPGLNSITHKAFNQIEKFLPAQPQILDIGCGKGVQTIELAGRTEGSVTAVDNRDFFLECLQKDAAKKGYSNIRCINADMAKLPFNARSFNLIWSEGAVFIIGIKEALKQWKQYLLPGGFFVFSDLVWFSNEKPDEAKAFWESQCEYILTVDEVLEEAGNEGYEVIDHFSLLAEGWTKSYFAPQKEAIRKLRPKYENVPEALEVFDALMLEHAMYARDKAYIGYEFFIIRAPQ